MKTQDISVDSIIDFESKQVTLQFSGKLNERLDLRKISTYVFGLLSDVEKIVLDMSGIQEMNSIGMRTWVEFINRMVAIGPARNSNAHCEFSRMSEIFVERANSYPEIISRANARVIEFEVPYYCEPCKKRQVRWVRAAEMNRQAPEPPAAKCEACSKPLRFDEDPSSYFTFLRLVRTD